ncbi:MAG: HAMP domain-containing histidine kinase [Candidatus Pacebacteria bacterium]|nr:HAMP domain-containing histidine kinase [Candidatus Paceibacterota bacterium]
MICPFFEEPLYYFFVPELGGLLYYAHIPAIVIALLVGFIVLFNDRKSLLNQLLFGICISFALWAFSTLVLWTNIHSDILLFAWAFLGPAAAFISIFSIYFTYVFVTKKDVGMGIKGVFLLLLVPLLVLAPSEYTLSGFNLVNCDAFSFEGLTNTVYFPALGGLAILWILFILLTHYKRTEPGLRKQHVLMGTGILLFLFSFFTTVFLGQYLATAGVLPDSQLETYGYFGMTVFAVYIGILIVRFSAFHVSLVISQMLVLALLILIGSQFTFIESDVNLILNSIAFVLTLLMGIVLVRSVLAEIRQRKQVEKLAKELAAANERLKQLDQLKDEFLSIASHQLRAPITAVRGYAANLSDGTYGVVPEYFKEPIQTIMETTRLMASSIDDYLNISRIEQGRMKYEKSEFDISHLTAQIVKELTPVAARKQLALSAEPAGEITIRADIGKIKQVITNLIDNAIKYTEKGGITVAVTKEVGKVRVTITDTGIGIGADEISSLFEKFTRARDANKVNTTGTGLGLYVAKQLAEGHGGRVWAESDGSGKGSRFIVELPALA